MSKDNIVLNKNEIRALIAHQPPFLFIDQIIFNEKDTLIAEKTFEKSEWFFQGHYPNYPVVPGVILIEAAAQATAVWSTTNKYTNNKIGFLTKVNNFQFKNIVEPGQKINIKIQFERKVFESLLFDIEILKKDKSIAKGSIIVTIKGEM